MPSEFAGPETELEEPDKPPPFAMGKTEICPFSPLAYRNCGTAQASLAGPQQPLSVHTFVLTLPHPPSASRPTRLVRISDSARLRIAPVDMAPPVGSSFWSVA